MSVRGTPSGRQCTDRAIAGRFIGEYTRGSAQVRASQVLTNSASVSCGDIECCICSHSDSSCVGSGSAHLPWPMLAALLATNASSTPCRATCCIAPLHVQPIRSLTHSPTSLCRCTCWMLCWVTNARGWWSARLRRGSSTARCAAPLARAPGPARGTGARDAARRRGARAGAASGWPVRIDLAKM